MQTSQSVHNKSDTGAALHAPGSDTQQYLTFSIGGEQFALVILSIKEIIQFGHITTVPLMPDYLRGVMNLRGAVVPVIDLSARFNRGATVPGKRTCIVIVEVQDATERRVIGLMVDSVSAVLEIPAVEIEPVPPLGAGIRSEFISGMARLNGKFVVILDVGQTFQLDEMPVSRLAASAEVATH
jgi:purine-binding chemotaxis protein CheW